MSELSKNEQIITYIVRYHSRATKTVVMKLCYLIDLISFKNTGKAIFNFEYIRYKYGPFDKKVCFALEKLEELNYITEESYFTPSGEENTYYSFNEKMEVVLDVKSEEKKLIDEVLESLKGYGARTLTEICYKTKPMKALKQH